jgi:DNA polymerase III subunit beta
VRRRKSVRLLLSFSGAIRPEERSDDHQAQQLAPLTDGLADARREIARIRAHLDLGDHPMTRISLPAAALAAGLDAVRFAARTGAMRAAVRNGPPVMHEASPVAILHVDADGRVRCVDEAERAADEDGPIHPLRLHAGDRRMSMVMPVRR